jgi:iron complex outermembrane receptor protein
MQRRPVETKGLELSGEYILSKELKFSALYSRIRGMTSNVVNGPIIREMGVSDINPDKIAGSATWKYSPQGDIRLGFTTLKSRDINVGRSGEEHTKGYTLFDLSANYDLKKWGTLSLGVENVANKFYFLSWSQVDFFRNYFAGRGRVTSLTHTITF